MFIDFEAKPLPFLVYGSLRPGFHNYEAIIAEYPHTVVEGCTVDNVDMFAYRRNFPYVTAGTGTVAGELVTVPDESFLNLLIELDVLEGYDGPKAADNHYVRTTMTVHTPDGDVEAYVYIAAVETAINVRETLPRVLSGDWAEWKSRSVRYA